ncbi:hypothetical protein SK128_012697 [Halocaridina rubra]|uniref:Uncharacterized protein n=1 Tax=Halocaridina rubra TaxID=373956 RepID=A0AAN8XAL0_HALRR
METGSTEFKRKVGKQLLVGQCDKISPTEVFDVVVDPLTDFKVSESSIEPSSPRQSFNLSPLNFHPVSEDTKLWSSSISLSSSSGSGSLKEKPGSTCAVGGGGNGHHRLLVPEVHRFGYNPPCAGSPHDLASCPVIRPSDPFTSNNKSERLSERKPGERNEKYDALRALSQASSALALTETLIGPLKIPPVSQEIISEVVSNMEKKGNISSIKSGQYSSGFQQTCPVPNAPLVTNPSPTPLRQPASGFAMTSDVDRKPIGSLPSILEPDVHRPFISNSYYAENYKIPSGENAVYESIHKLHNGETSGVKNSSCVIAVPVGMSDQGPIEVYKEVHPYPAHSITTTVERCSYIGQTQTDSKPPCSASRRKKHSQKSKNKLKNEHRLSQSSLASESSECSSAASDRTIVSKNSSEISPVPCSHMSLKERSNKFHIGGDGPLSKPLLSTAIKQMRQALDSVSVASDNRSDRSSGGGLDAASTFSDTSSNLSTLSDLSGYEDEYMRIKRLVSDAVIPPEDYKKLLSKTITKPPVTKSVLSVDYEKLLRDVNAQKEDLEIQLHRLSIQVQNAVREKELYQQQLELMNTKITETNQKQYFEVLKQRANLEGQLEMLKQELENSVYEKNQLLTKVSENAKALELLKSEASAAKEAESQIKLRLKKYEEANHELEGEIRMSKEDSEKVRSECKKIKKDLSLVSDKNIALEVSMEKMQASESQFSSEIKGLRLLILQLQEECQAKTTTQLQAESLANKTASELKSSQNTCHWYQDQLQQAQTARANIQQELLEARAIIARLTTEKESLDIKVQTLVREAEDGQSRAVREKASLLAHLEALQADMAEREALVSQLERDRGSDTKLMEDRRQRLEQDRHRIHKLRLDLSDTERQLETLRDDLKHKCTLISKYERELKALRTAEAVNQEIIGEKDARIQNLEQDLSESKLLLSNEQQELKQIAQMVTALKEDKAKLEISLTAAYNEKREVDDAILKVREDMTKLSSNFYRMKHDLALKDRHVEDSTKETDDAKRLMESYKRKFEMLELKVKEDDEKIKLTQEIEKFKNDAEMLSKEKEEKEEKLQEVTKTMKTVEIEKKSMAEAVELREEQIQNMQASLESYREEILKKDEELYVAHEHTCSLEKSYTELRRNWEMLKDDNLALRQEAEAYQEHEQSQRRELSDLKESIQKERKLKQTLEKNMEKLSKMQEESQLSKESEKCELEKVITNLTLEMQLMKEDKLKSTEVLSKLESDRMIAQRELTLLSEENTELESKLKETLAQAEGFKNSSLHDLENLKALEIRVDDLSKENSALSEKLAIEQNDRCRQLAEWEEQLRCKEDELLKVKAVVGERETNISKLKQEKKQACGQVSSLSMEIEQLRKKLATNEAMVKEMKASDDHNTGGRGSGKVAGNIQKELLPLQTKLSDAELKLKEITKEKEKLQTAVKNTKKESLLMKAKTREFEALKAKCKDFEEKDFSALEGKHKELASKLQAYEGKISSLERTLNEKESHSQVMDERVREISSAAENLAAEKRDLQCKVNSLEELCQKCQDNLCSYQSLLKAAENDRDEWMVKYESLRDIIPERDTSTQPAVQLGVSNQSFRSSQETLSLSSLEHNSSVNTTHSDMGFYSDLSQASISDRSQFDKTMADLQAQVTLTPKALHTKEKQITDLQHQLSVLRTSDMYSSADYPIVDGTSEAIPLHIHNRQIQSLQEKLRLLQERKESSDSQTGTAALKDEVRKLESSVKTKESELEKAQAKVNEFQEKHRRYESNVRLLTRKLKEHMKGRKSAEKEMQHHIEEHQLLMNEEHQRYSVLRCRCIELESLVESLEGQVASMETEVEEVRSALSNALKEVEEHRNHSLALQKDIGRLQEATKSIETLQLESSKLKEKVTEREAEIKELEQNQQSLLEQLKEKQETLTTLKFDLEKQQSESLCLQQKCQDSEEKLKDVSNQLHIKEDECYRVECILKDTENGKSHLIDQMKVSEEEKRLLQSEIEKVKEQQIRESDEKQRMNLLLEETVAKKKAVEDHIKVIEGELNAAKEELNLVKETQTSHEAALRIVISQLQDSVSKSREEVALLSSQLGEVQKERVNYQMQATELRSALHSTLAQLKTLQAAEEAREAEASTFESEVGIIPSPSPLDLTSLTELMEKSVRPVRSSAPLNSLQSCLSSLKAEVATLQSQLQHKQEEMGDELSVDEVGTDLTSADSLNSPSETLEGAEVV